MNTMPIKTHKVRIYPNAQMRQVLDAGFGYARYCYNQGLELWNVMYESFVLTGNLKFKPNGNKIRDILVNEKEDWQFSFSARILQTAILNLKKAWQNFFNPNMIHSKRPTFKSKRHKRQSFTTDRAKVWIRSIWSWTNLLVRTTISSRWRNLYVLPAISKPRR